ncbi:hypothetical protein H4219_003376 [Mycoemilia scoparia]|uniref:MFS general substrate transporter n=1 Tax=Mycoemilia scoparia TaxID=417184 RepID=A0A9W7ZYW3_9FUNG|nr:hypothetical protein H4219_003376 [Mycoemilia scoparia]
MGYYSAKVQIYILGLVCFFGPGMFNALNGMGGGGQLNQKNGNNANTALYSTFTLFGLVGGAIVNLFGIRPCMFIAGLTYALYSGSYILVNSTGNGSLTVACGALLGAGAGVFWAAQGMIMMSYPRDDEKGAFITIFWVIFNLGGVLGGIVPFVINYHNTGALSNAAYIAFVVLESLGAFMSWALVPPRKVVRADGSHIKIDPHPSIKSQLQGMGRIMTNPLIFALIPLSFSSNFYYSYQFSVYNGKLFTTRTRGFNNMWYWCSEIIASLCFGALLDTKSMSRKKRGIVSLSIVAVLWNLCWILTYRIQRHYSADKEYPGGQIDFLEPHRSALPIALYAFMGVCDALWQNMAYWLLGTLATDPSTSAHYAGVYKSMQSLGAAVAWQLAAKEVNYMVQMATNWALINLSIPTMLFVTMRIKDSDKGMDGEQDITAATTTTYSRYDGNTEADTGSYSWNKEKADQSTIAEDTTGLGRNDATLTSSNPNYA